MKIGEQLDDHEDDAVLRKVERVVAAGVPAVVGNQPGIADRVTAVLRDGGKHPLNRRLQPEVPGGEDYPPSLFHRAGSRSHRSAASGFASLGSSAMASLGHSARHTPQPKQRRGSM